MAIRKMVNKDRAAELEAKAPGCIEVVTNYHGHPEPLYMYTCAEGRVVGLREANFYDDSDFYATFYDPETDSFVEEQYATTRAWCYPNSATIDAPENLRQRYAAYAEAQARLMLAGLEARRLERERKAGRHVQKGDRVRVAKGRKVPLGTEGVVFWVGRNAYGIRAGLNDANGNTHWTATTNLEVVGA